MSKSIYDLAGKVIMEDEIGFHWEFSYEHGSDIVKMSKKEQKMECFYGLGDKPTHFNLKGKRLENWVTDEYAYGKDRDPLYKAVPFYVGLHDDVSYGVFFDNTFRTFFDFGHERRNVVSFWAQGGEMNYYFFYGPHMGAGGQQLYRSDRSSKSATLWAWATTSPNGVTIPRAMSGT